MWECNYPNQLDQTLTGLYPPSSLVQSQYNVQFSPRVNRAGKCPGNSQPASGCVDDVSIMQIARKPWHYKHLGTKKKYIHTKTPMKMSANWRHDEIRETLLARAAPKSSDKFKKWQETQLFMTKLRDWLQRVFCIMSPVRATCHRNKFPVGENVSHKVNLLLYPTCVKAQLWNCSYTYCKSLRWMYMWDHIMYLSFKALL